MVARTMFAKFKSSGGAASAPVAPNALESNPICNLYEVGKQIATAGPENVWRILEGRRKSDGKVRRCLGKISFLNLLNLNVSITVSIMRIWFVAQNYTYNKQKLLKLQRKLFQKNKIIS